jgi:hypothetical protein
MSMISIQELWDRFRLAQNEHNADAAICLHHAIEAHVRCDYPSAVFWYRQAQMCESKAVQ